MAGEYTRMNYDNEASRQRTQRSTDPLLYRLDPNFAVNCGRCFPQYDRVGGLGGSDAVGNQVDIDSILRGVAQLNSKSNSQQIPISLSGYNLTNYKDCSDQIETESSRYLTPAYEIRGMATQDLRLEYPLEDPQCNIFESFALNTRLQAKDNHRTVWQVPLDQRDALPVERLGRVMPPNAQSK